MALVKKYLQMHTHLRNQWLPETDLAAIQNNKLQKIVHHAYDKVPYYKDMFDSIGLTPRDITCARDLQKLPITTNDDIRSLPLSDLTARGINLQTCIHGRTSGSTGVAHSVILSPQEMLAQIASWNTLLYVCGRTIFGRVLSITSKFPRVYKKRWYEYIGIGRTDFLLMNQSPAILIQKIQAINPEIILSYPTNLLALADVINKKGITNIRPKTIISTSEILDTHARTYISEAFQTDIIDSYGSWETGIMAWECCKHEGYHINADTVIVEIVKNNTAIGPGETGEIIITNLNVFSMPFIRFNLQDLGKMSAKKCSCGRSLPLLEKVEGRSDELIILPNGELLPPIIFYALKYVRGVEKFQVIQETLNNLVVSLVVDQDDAATIMNNVEKTLQAVLHNKITVEIKIADDIQPYPSGKRQCVISKIKPTFNKAPI